MLTLLCGLKIRLIVGLWPYSANLTLKASELALKKLDSGPSGFGHVALGVYGYRLDT